MMQLPINLLSSLLPDAGLPSDQGLSAGVAAGDGSVFADALVSLLSGAAPLKELVPPVLAEESLVLPMAETHADRMIDGNTLSKDDITPLDMSDVPELSVLTGMILTKDAPSIGIPEIALGSSQESGTAIAAPVSVDVANSKPPQTVSSKSRSDVINQPVANQPVATTGVSLTDASEVVPVLDAEDVDVALAQGKTKAALVQPKTQAVLTPEDSEGVVRNRPVVHKTGESSPELGDQKRPADYATKLVSQTRPVTTKSETVIPEPILTKHINGTRESTSTYTKESSGSTEVREPIVATTDKGASRSTQKQDIITNLPSPAPSAINIEESVKPKIMISDVQAQVEPQKVPQAVAKATEVLQKAVASKRSETNSKTSRSSVEVLAKSESDSKASQPSTEVLAKSENNSKVSRPSVEVLAKSENNSKAPRPSNEVFAKPADTSVASTPSKPIEMPIRAEISIVQAPSDPIQVQIPERATPETPIPTATAPVESATSHSNTTQHSNSVASLHAAAASPDKSTSMEVVPTRQFIVEVPKPLRVPGQLRVRIDPPQFGHIRVDLTSTGNGIIGTMRIASEQTREIVERQIGDLHKSLADAGVRVERLEVVGASRSDGRQSFHSNTANHHDGGNPWQRQGAMSEFGSDSHSNEAAQQESRASRSSLVTLDGNESSPPARTAIGRLDLVA